MLQGIRENDRPLMAEFYRVGYQAKQMVALNVVRCYQNLLHISDIVKCNENTLDEFVLSDSIETSVLYTFPREDPTTSDFKLWDEAVRRLCSGTLRLPYTLGRYLSRPHLPIQWFTDNQSSKLFLEGHDITNPTYDRFIPRTDRVVTRHGRNYEWDSTVYGRHTRTQYASVTMVSPTVAVLHSCTPCPTTLRQPTSFLEVLHSYGNGCDLWEDLVVDGDGEWLQQ
jgi:hypothetical protein